VSILPWFPKESPTRNVVTRSQLQSAITDAVKKSDPECEVFVDVIVQMQTPKSRFDANWAIRGIKFGKADREKSTKALEAIVERLQSKYNVSEDQPVKK
jgi:hypothetical protein